MSYIEQFETKQIRPFNQEIVRFVEKLWHNM